MNDTQPDDDPRYGMSPTAGPVTLWSVVATVTACAALATWWIVGNLNEAGGYDETDSYMVRTRPTIPQPAEIAAGAAALATLGALVAWLLVRSARRPFRRGWWLVLYLYAFAGVGVGGSLRILTARTDGANIGAGWAVLGIGPLVVMTLIAATLWLRALLRRAPVADDPALSPTEVQGLAYASFALSVGGLSPYFGFLVFSLPIVPGINAVILGTPAVRRLRRTELTPAKGLAIAGVAIGLVSILTYIPLFIPLLRGWWL